MDIVFIETSEYIKKIDKIASQDEFFKLQNDLISKPEKGKIEKVQVVLVKYE